jgi:hypothetical protein
VKCALAGLQAVLIFACARSNALFAACASLTLPGYRLQRRYQGFVMKMREWLLVLDRCELKAKYNVWTGWQVSAKGALPIALLAFTVLVVWAGQR